MIIKFSNLGLYVLWKCYHCSCSKIFICELFVQIAFGILADNYPDLNVLRSQVSREEQKAAIEELLNRKLPYNSWQFDIRTDLDYKDTNDQYSVMQRRFIFIE